MTRARTPGRTNPRQWHPLRASAQLCACAAILSCRGPAPNAPLERLVVPKRASLTVVAESLAAHGIIASPRKFLLAARIYGWFSPRLRGLDRHLLPGRYEFHVGERTKAILLKMVTGLTADDYFTVPEGYTVREIARAAHQKLGMDSVAFLDATLDPALQARLGIPSDVGGIEGYLFPAKYRVVFGASPEQLVRQMVLRFLSVWDTTMDRKAAAIGLTRHQVMTLASIVEAEARVSAERRIIAGVYENRLQRRHPMKLEADPTVIYALGNHVNRVLRRHLQVKSPYNTYLHGGLPPGPIGSPGRASILATLNPGRHSYLFFVARPDGTHMFSSTGEEHADSVAVARRLRAEWQAATERVAAEARRDSVAAAAARRSTRQR